MVKKIVTFLVFLLLIHPELLYSQEWKWVNKIAGTDIDEVSAMVTDNQGNVTITGRFKNVLRLDQSNTLMTLPGQFDGFIASFNSDGTFRWAQEFGGKGDDAGSNIACDEMGNVYLIAQLQSTETDFGKTIISGKEPVKIVLAKFNNQGKQIWVKKLTEGNAYTIPIGIAAFGSNVCLSLHFNSSQLLFDGKIITSLGLSDIVFAMFSTSDGSLKWVKQVGQYKNDFAETVAIDSEGNCFLSGRSFGNFNDTIFVGNSKLLAGMNYTSFIAKFDTNGNTLWTKKVSGTGGAFSDGLALSRNGNLIASFYYGTGMHFVIDTTLGASAPGNFVIVALNNQGERLWMKQFPSAEIGRINGLATDSENNIYFGGYLGGKAHFDHIVLNPENATDISNFIVKLSSDGMTQAAATVATQVSPNAINMIAAALPNQCYITGFSAASPIMFGQHSLSNSGMTDVYLALWQTPPTPAFVTQDIAEISEEPKQEIITHTENPIPNITTNQQNNQKTPATEKPVEQKVTPPEKKQNVTEIKDFKTIETKTIESKPVTPPSEPSAPKPFQPTPEPQNENKNPKTQKSVTVSNNNKDSVLHQPVADKRLVEKPAEPEKKATVQYTEKKPIQEPAQKPIPEKKPLDVKSATPKEPETEPDPAKMVWPNPTTGTFFIKVPAKTNSIIIYDEEKSFVYHNFTVFQTEKVLEINLENHIGKFTIEVKTQSGKKFEIPLIKQ